MTKFTAKVLGAYERHERSKAAFEAAGWTLVSDMSHKWTKANRQVRVGPRVSASMSASMRLKLVNAAWVLIESDDLNSVCSADIREGKFVIARTNGDPEDLLGHCK